MKYMNIKEVRTALDELYNAMAKVDHLIDADVKDWAFTNIESPDTDTEELCIQIVNLAEDLIDFGKYMLRKK